MKSRILMSGAVVIAVVLLVGVSSANAGLFFKHGCCEPTCCEPAACEPAACEPACCEPTCDPCCKPRCGLFARLTARFACCKRRSCCEPACCEEVETCAPACCN